MNEFKLDIAMTEKVLHQLHNRLGVLEKGMKTKFDFQFTLLHNDTGANSSHKMNTKQTKRDPNHGYSVRGRRESYRQRSFRYFEYY